jgi:hypothetical protein
MAGSTTRDTAAREATTLDAGAVKDCDAEMKASHATLAEILFHARTGVTKLSCFKYRRADAEPLPTQRI